MDASLVRIYTLRSICVKFGGFKRSARQYASAVELWGQASDLHRVAAWPPTEQTLAVFVGLFRSGVSLGRYLSHIRKILRWLRAPLGAVESTTWLVNGAKKSTPEAFLRPKQRATNAQTKLLIEWSLNVGCRLMGAIWSVTRHVCSRCSETLRISSPTALVTFGTSSGKPTCTITVLNRKCFSEPVEVPRTCCCKGRSPSIGCDTEARRAA